MASYLVPYDFSAHARAALALALEWAARSGAEVRLLHVVQEPLPMAFPWDGAAAMAPMRGQLREAAEQALNEVASEVARDGGVQVVTETLEGPNVSQAICEAAARHQTELIVMGTHGTGGFLDALLGSVASKTIGRAPCPVLTLRAPEDGEA